MMKNKLTYIEKYLPENVSHGIEMLSVREKDMICEIRLRAFGAQSLSLSDGRVLFLSCDGDFCEDPMSYHSFSVEDISETVTCLCDGSVYSFSESLKKGYITKHGMRIGVCGRGMSIGGIPDGFCEYTSLNIRIPRYIPSCCDELLSYIGKHGMDYAGGIIVISPPGAGKTTFLRTLGYSLSRGISIPGKTSSFEVCICDEREELFLPEVFGNGRAEFIFSLPKKYCIEHFTRLMNPDYIILDEIGNGGEAEEILRSSSEGIHFCASCHGIDVSDVLSKSGMRLLFENRVFSTACVLSIKNGQRICIVKRVEEYL